MRRLLAIAVTVVLALGLVVGTHATADAAKKKTFKQVHVCASGRVDPPTALEAVVNAGRWTFEQGPDDPCFSDLITHFYPSVGRFKAVYRWYAGSRLIKKQTTTAANKGQTDGGSLLRQPGMTYSSSGTWKLKGKRLKVTITLSKRGYVTKQLTVTSFALDG